MIGAKSSFEFLKEPLKEAHRVLIKTPNSKVVITTDFDNLEQANSLLRNIKQSGIFKAEHEMVGQMVKNGETITFLGYITLIPK